jgi:hypothetical protein
MTPRAVLMTQAVTAAGVPAEQGNILAPNWRSWQNNNYSYYTRGPAQGFGTKFMYSVHSFPGGEPAWAQPPHRMFGKGFSAALYPVADSTVAPPIDTLS